MTNQLQLKSQKPAKSLPCIVLPAASFLEGTWKNPNLAEF